MNTFFNKASHFLKDPVFGYERESENNPIKTQIEEFIALNNLIERAGRELNPTEGYQYLKSGQFTDLTDFLENAGKEWNTMSSYFSDWVGSDEFQDLNLLDKILDEIESQLNDRPLQVVSGSEQQVPSKMIDMLISLLQEEFHGFRQFDSTFYQDYTNECRFVVRVLYRKVEEMQLKDKNLNRHQALLNSVSSLKESLKKDKLVRVKNNQARLDHFTDCNLQAKNTTFKVAVVALSLFFGGLYCLKKAGK